MTMFRWPLNLPALRRAFGPLPLPENPAVGGSNDWLFVTDEQTRGWILDAICREIGSHQRGTWEVLYAKKHVELPPAKTYFFSHYLLYLANRRGNPHLADSNVMVWWTHPRDSKYSIEEQVKAYNGLTQLIFTCSMFRDMWVERGVKPEKATVVLGAADPKLFRPHQRGQGVVGLSSAFYERKNPDTLLDLVKSMPHRRFVLLGHNWEAYSRWEELSAAPNFQYVSAPYSEYPAWNRRFDVFVSLATLEGGPIPLMEAMMCNAVPVASRTGFAPDIIRHGENGFLFDVGAPAQEIAPLIDQAFALRTDVHATVKRYSWERFAKQIHALAPAR